MGSYNERLRQLNEAQALAVTSLEGPLLVIAGPGTGKTQLLSMRVAHILQQTDAGPGNILCLTFTEAAAQNMRQRLRGLIGPAASRVGIYTFHGFGTDVIQRYPEYFIDQPLLQPVDELGAYELLLSLFAQLPHGNPLQQKVGNDYLHLPSVRAAISWCKQAGLEPEDLRQLFSANQAFIDFAEPLFKEAFAERPGPKLLPQYQQLLLDLRAYEPPTADSSLADLLINQLAAALEEVDPNGRYAPSITAWRNAWLVQNHLKNWGLADKRKNNFVKALAEFYESYQSSLAEHGWYTFDDMILRTIKALETEEALRLTLQEQFQYIMVDEYQDTNGAQNRLLELLADNPVNEGRPNLMVVGDDDQAIYRFQGAHMSIMLDFTKRWRDVKQVVLTENYRSNQELLDLARQVIVQGEDRLEQQLPDLSKTLHANRPTAKEPISYREATSEMEQYAHIASEIGQKIASGQAAASIAILAPKHSYLQALVPFLIDQQVPISYERREHILEQPKIIELISLAELVLAAAAGDWGRVDSLLPAVLAADYWQLDTMQLWRLSLQAYQERRSWPEIMLEQDDPQLQQIAQALPVLAQAAGRESLETMLDILLGNRPLTVNDELWRVPYKQVYFSQPQLQTAPQEYFRLLGHLQTLCSRLREYQPDRRLTLADFSRFVELYQHSNLNLVDTNPHTTNSDAVELLTAYKAKGLEWNTVYLLGCHNNIWGPRTRSSNYSFGLPSNLAWIKPARDQHDDRLRLFYVALTRARHQLYLQAFRTTSSGKATEPLEWLNEELAALPASQPLPSLELPELIHSQELAWAMTEPVQADLQTVLEPFLANYQLSATHLASFLDISRGGPRQLFVHHMLHFPEALSSGAVFGLAMHHALHYLHSTFTKTKQLPALPATVKVLNQYLSSSRLAPGEVSHLAERGQRALAAFYEQQATSLLPNDKSEYDFKTAGVQLGPARLTGKLDVLRLTDAGACIIDYKSASPFTSWKPPGIYPRLRAHLYKQQLGFYKLLVDGADLGPQFQATEGRIQFLEPDQDGQLISLSHPFDAAHQARLQELVAVVWQHITSLNFPDTSDYKPDLSGILQFEQDLLDGKL